MKSTGCAAAIVLVAVLGVAAPAACAKTTKLKGQVIGQSYAAGKSTVVPVLLDRRSGRRARLKSRVGTLRVSAKRVRAPRRKRIATRLLRTGDVIQTRAKVRRSVRRVAYWQLKARKLRVKRRSGTLSPAELQELIAALRTDLTQLGAAVAGLARNTAEQFKAVRAELASLRADMSALRSEFATLAAQVAAAGAQLAALEAQLQGLGSQFEGVLADVAALNDAVTSLGAELGTLQGQVATLTSELAALSATVGTLSGRLGDLSNLDASVEALLTGVAPGDISGALADIGTLQTDLAALDGVIGGPSSGLVQQVNALSGVVGGAGTGLVGAVSALQASDVANAADIAALETAVGDAEGRLDDLETLVSGPGGLAQDVGALETTVGDSGSGLVQQVGALQTNVNILCGPTSPLNALC